ncbi:MAG: hypothetical protein R2834_19655 [Rhodothermales bacterium]
MNRHSIVLLVFVLAAGCAGSRGVKDEVTGLLAPGDARLAYEAVSQPAVRRFSLWIERDADRQSFGTLTETIRRTSDGGVVRVQRLESPRGVQVDSLSASATFAPRTHHSVNPARTVDLTYGPRAASGTFTSVGTPAVAVNDPIPEPAFDSNFIDLIARAVPLTRGYAASVRTYERASDQPEDTEVFYSVWVGVQERILDRLVVVVSFEKVGGPVTRLFVDMETRALIQQRTDVAPGVTLVIEPSDS